jgi:hypothetical protein
MATRGQVTSDFAAGWPFAIETNNDSLNAQAIAKLAPVAAPALCAAPGCGGDGRYTLNGSSACSRRCLDILMRSALLRKQTQTTEAPPKSRTHVRIGSILVDQGIITEGQLERALRAQMAAGAGRLGCWLKQQSNLSEADFTAALAIQWRCPVLPLGTFSAIEMASTLPRWMAEEGGAIPLRLSGQPQRLTLAFEDHINDEITQAVEQMLGIGVDPGLLTASEFWQATRELLTVRYPPAARLRASSLDGMVEALSHALSETGATTARMVMVQGKCWMRFWVESTAQGLVSRDLLCESDSNVHLLNATADTREVESLHGATLRLGE